ncbi:MAG: carboxy terminal-processing peptidase [Pseudomonadales bacterium]|nr:carboxy terminal-processing peptidase [Pseudomonadales bacterium]
MQWQIHRGTWLYKLVMTGLAVFSLHAHANTAQTSAADSQDTQLTESFEKLAPLDAHARTSLTVVEQLRHNHFVKKSLDDELSSEIFDNYLAALDGGRAYFLASDIEEFESYRFKLDDALKRGNLKPAFEIFNRYQAHVINRLEFLLAQIENSATDIDFTLDEQMALDREEAAWPQSPAEQDELWRKRLKSAVLSMRLNDKDIDEIIETLTKRYKYRLKQALQIKSEDAFQTYINAFSTTYDPHTQYFSPRTSQNFNINMSLSLEGIGAVLKSDEDHTEVVRLVPAGPADKAGNIEVADQIISVGQGSTGPLIDVVGWRLDDVVELIRGPKGSTVRLEIIASEKDDDTAKVISIVRNTVKLEEQAAQAKLMTFNENGREYRIGVIDVPTFYIDFKASQQGEKDYRSTTRDVTKLIHQLKKENIDGLVIDLRNNGGGSLQEADTLTGLFIKSGPTVQVKSARRRANVYADNDNAITWDGPMAVVVNRLSASASEIFAGAIQDYGRGVIVGSQTFGKGTVQTLVPLNRGQLKITAAKFYRVSGQSTQHQGVMPDVSFPNLYNTDHIGESALDDAMPWDVIQAASFDAYGQISSLLPELNTRHKDRVEDNIEFDYFRAIAQKGVENASRTHISLNEATRKTEKAADDQWRLGLENSIRTAKGKPPALSLDQLDELIEAEDKAKEELAEQATSTEEGANDPNRAPAKIEFVEDDAMLEEAGQILLDLIGLSTQIANNTPAESKVAAAILPLSQPTAGAVNPENPDR